MPANGPDRCHDSGIRLRRALNDRAAATACWYRWPLALLACLISAVVWADEVDDAIALLRAGKAEQAYQLLAPLIDKQAGNERFDLTMGAVALDSGRPLVAVAALELALLKNPRLTVARVDLARAYLALTRYADAKRELTELLAGNPPPQARPVLERMLAAAETGIRAETFGVVTGYIEAGYGRDSNLTAASSNFTGGVQDAYGLPGFLPTGNSVLRSANFSQVTAGVDYLRPLNSNWAFIAGATGYWRGYEQASAYNQTSGDVRVGALHTDGRHLLRLSLTLQSYEQETEAPGAPKPTSDRRSTGLAADWRYNLDLLWSIGLFGAVNRSRYPDNTVLDYDQTQAGVSLTRRFISAANASVTISPSYTDDRATNNIPGSATGANFSRRTGGARLFGQFDPVAKVTVFASLGYFVRKDASDFARSTIIARGEDKQTDYSLGASWRFARNWSLRALASLTENRSNISLYSYNRNEFFVGLRYDFR